MFEANPLEIKEKIVSVTEHNDKIYCLTDKGEVFTIRENRGYDVNSKPITEWIREDVIIRK